MSFLS
jgi:hypothetical protein